jgi:DNA-binding transcriptional ArsR family regulator
LVFDVLGEPRRRQILDLLGEGERPVGELVDSLGLSQPTVSKHRRLLREAGLVEAERRGRWAYYRLVPEAVEALAHALAA